MQAPVVVMSEKRLSSVPSNQVSDNRKTRRVETGKREEKRNYRILQLQRREEPCDIPLDVRSTNNI